MSIKSIRSINGQKFIDDLKSVTEVLVYADTSKVFITVAKKYLMREAETQKIEYYLSRNIYTVKRLVMIVL